MTTSMLVLLILLAYVAIMFAVGKCAKKRINSFEDAISAPGQTSLLLLACSAIAGQIGSGFVIGGAEYGALYGIGGAWYGIACGLSYLVTAALSKFIYTHRFVSLSDYFAQRYEGTATRLIYSIATMCSCIALLAGQLLAGRAVFLTLGLPAAWGVALTALIALVYANVSGLWGSMAMSTVQTAIIFSGMVAALCVMLHSPGPELLVQRLPAACFQPIPFNSEFLVATVVPILLASPVNQIAFQTIASAKTAGTAVRGYVLAGLCLIPVAMIPPLLGMFGRSLFPGLPAAEVFTSLLQSKLPVLVAALILAAIICAVTTSCNVCYIAVATNFVHDIYQGMIAPQADSKTCKRLMVLVNLAVCGIGIFLALRMNDIIRLLSMGYSLLAAGCLVPFLGGVLWKGGTGKGALCSAFVGMSASLASSLGLLQLPFACITSVLLSAVAYVLGSLLTKKPGVVGVTE